MGYGKKINELLQKQNMTVAELSRKTHIKPTTLYSIIDNDSSDLKISVAYAISNALNISFSELTGLPINSKFNSLYDFFPDAEIKTNGDGHYEVKLANLAELKPYYSLNSKGRRRAQEYFKELNQIKEYTDKDDV